MRRIMKCLTAVALLSLSATPPAWSKDEPVSVTKGEKRLPLPGEALRFGDRDAFVIAPDTPAEGKPWVWYAPTLRGLPGKHEIWYFERLLKEGIAIAGIDVGESYGSPNGRKAFEDFRIHLVKERGFSAKPCLLARSRGGLMLYNWAVEHPQNVSAVAGVYPVCNISSYPGVAKAAGAYEMSAEALEKALETHNPIDRVEPLAKAKVPVRHIHGDSDRVVPLELNSAALAKNYRKWGGEMEIEVIEKGGHDLWAGWFESEALIDFMIKHAKAGAQGAPAE